MILVAERVLQQAEDLPSGRTRSRASTACIDSFRGLPTTRDSAASSVQSFFRGQDARQGTVAHLAAQARVMSDGPLTEATDQFAREVRPDRRSQDPRPSSPGASLLRTSSILASMRGCGYLARPDVLLIIKFSSMDELDDPPPGVLGHSRHAVGFTMQKGRAARAATVGIVLKGLGVLEMFDRPGDRKTLAATELHEYCGRAPAAPCVPPYFAVGRIGAEAGAGRLGSSTVSSQMRCDRNGFSR